MPKANRGDLEIAILTTLEHTDRYGIEIHDTIDQRTQQALEYNQGSLYVAFKRLEKHGWIRGYWRDSSSGGGARKYYHLTEKGKQALQQKREEWRARRALLDAFFEGS